MLLSQATVWERCFCAFCLEHFFCILFILQIDLHTPRSCNTLAAQHLSKIKAGQELEVIVEDPLVDVLKWLSDSSFKNKVAKALSNGDAVQIGPGEFRQEFRQIPGRGTPCSFERAFQIYEEALKGATFVESIFLGQVMMWINKLCSTLVMDVRPQQDSDMQEAPQHMQEVPAGAPPPNFDKHFTAQSYDAEKVSRDVLNMQDVLLRLLRGKFNFSAEVYYTRYGLVINGNDVHSADPNRDPTLLQEFVESNQVTNALVYAVINEVNVSFQGTSDGKVTCSIADDVPDRPDDMKHYWFQGKLWQSENPYENPKGRLWLEKQFILFDNPRQLPPPDKAFKEYPGNLPDDLKMPTTSQDLKKAYERLMVITGHYEKQLYLFC